MPGAGDVEAQPDLVHGRGDRLGGLADGCDDPEDHQGGLRLLHYHQHRPQDTHRHGLRPRAGRRCRYIYLPISRPRER